jgi:hypothetical protein
VVPLDAAAPPADASTQARGDGEKNVGWLVVSTRPKGLRVLIDNVDSGRVTPIAPPDRLELPAGHHRIAFEVDGVVYTYPFTIEAGKEKEVVRQLPATEESNP